MNLIIENICRNLWCLNHKLQRWKRRISTVSAVRFKVEKFTDLTDAQWAILQKFVDTGRKIKKDLRLVLNCILKVTRTGTQWRNIGEKYGLWESVYYYFRKWTKDGIFDGIIVHLVEKERVRQGRKPHATAGAINS